MYIHIYPLPRAHTHIIYKINFITNIKMIKTDLIYYKVWSIHLKEYSKNRP